MPCGGRGWWDPRRTRARVAAACPWPCTPCARALGLPVITSRYHAGRNPASPNALRLTVWNHVPFEPSRLVRYFVRTVFKCVDKLRVDSRSRRALCPPCWLPYYSTIPPNGCDHSGSRMQCPSPACNVLRYSVLCASSRQRGRRKLPRTVRMSYRLNGLPASVHGCRVT